MHPKKLINSKWTAIKPQNKEKHFVVIKVNVNEDDKQIIDSIVVEAIFTKRHYTMDWRDLKDRNQWLQGWE